VLLADSFPGFLRLWLPLRRLRLLRLLRSRLWLWLLPQILVV
jgi:hypothetical protein